MFSHFAESFTTVIGGFYMGINSGFDKVHFINVVVVDSKIRALAKALEIKETEPGQFRTKTQVTVEIADAENLR